MKVISGRLKGRIIKGFDNPKTRPTMDRVKESLFAMIQSFTSNSDVLDVFSGSGNLVIEAISQGASSACCNDIDKKAYQTIKENIKQLELTTCVEVYHLDYKKFLEVLKDKKKKFDIIFLDPPYQTNYIKEALELILKYQLLKEKGIVICESDSLSKILYSADYQILKQKRYKDKFIVILTHS